MLCVFFCHRLLAQPWAGWDGGWDDGGGGGGRGEGGWNAEPVIIACPRGLSTLSTRRANVSMSAGTRRSNRTGCGGGDGRVDVGTDGDAAGSSDDAGDGEQALVPYE